MHTLSHPFTPPFCLSRNKSQEAPMRREPPSSAFAGLLVLLLALLRHCRNPQTPLLLNPTANITRPAAQCALPTRAPQRKFQSAVLSAPLLCHGETAPRLWCPPARLFFNAPGSRTSAPTGRQQLKQPGMFLVGQTISGMETRTRDQWLQQVEASKSHQPDRAVLSRAGHRGPKLGDETGVVSRSFAGQGGGGFCC